MKIPKYFLRQNENKIDADKGTFFTQSWNRTIECCEAIRGPDLLIPFTRRCRSDDADTVKAIFTVALKNEGLIE